MGACKRCENCGAYSPNIRKDGSNKLFQVNSCCLKTCSCLPPPPRAMVGERSNIQGAAFRLPGGILVFFVLNAGCTLQQRSNC